MHTTTSLHADHQLDQLAGQFEHWRQTRAHPGERIPHHLWEQAAALAQVLPYSRVAQHVRVSPSDLKKHMAACLVTTAGCCLRPFRVAAGFKRDYLHPHWGDRAAA